MRSLYATMGCGAATGALRVAVTSGPEGIGAMARIGDMIFRARQRKGWSQAKLAAKIRKHAPRISQWENNKVKPNERDLALLEKALECSLRDAAIGDKIYDARSRKGWSQAELATKIGKHGSQISNWENDKIKPNERDLALLENALDCSLQDIASQIQDCLDNFPVTALGIAKEAGVSPPTIYNIRDGKVVNPRKPTADRILRALTTLRERHADYADDAGYADDAEESQDDGDSAEEYRPEERKFLIEGALGKGGDAGKFIKRYRLFNPHNKEHVASLPETPGVYLLYAGNDDVAIPSEVISGDAVATIKRLRIVGTPEYVGKADNIRSRIRGKKTDHEKGITNTWWYREDWINLAVYVETDIDLSEELETLLIKLLSPQANINKVGVKV